MKLPTRSEWEALGFSVPDEICTPEYTMNSEKESFDQCTAERMEYEHLLAEQNRLAGDRYLNMRDAFKAMRMAVNAIDDGEPKLAQEILGDALRAYGEEQP